MEKMTKAQIRQMMDGTLYQLKQCLDKTAGHGSEAEFQGLIIALFDQIVGVIKVLLDLTIEKTE